MAEFSTLQDSFSGSLSTLWQHIGGGALNGAKEYIAAGQLNLPAQGDYSGGVETISTYQMTMSGVATQIIQRPTQGGANSTEMYFGVRDSADSGDYANWILTGGGGWVVEVYVNGSSVSSNFGTYDPVSMKWIRIQVLLGVIYFDTSPDGVMWTGRHSVAVPSGLSTSSLRCFMQCGDYGGQTTPGTGIYDNINVLGPAMNAASRNFFAFF